MAKKSSLNGPVLRYNVGSQVKYYESIKRLIDKMISDSVKQITKLLQKNFSKEYFGKVSVTDESISSQARILLNKLSKDYYSLFSSKARSMAERMVYGQEKLSNASLKNSVNKMAEGVTLTGNIVSPELEEIIKASVEANVSLIKSIPDQYFKDITGEVMRGITTGKGQSDISKSLKKYDGVTTRRAKEIAADQVRKVYSAVNVEKFKQIDLKEFRWVHSGGGQHPRDSHVMMDGKIFSLDHAELIRQQQALGVKTKDQGLPGYPVNCRCTMQAVINFD